MAIFLHKMHIFEDINLGQDQNFDFFAVLYLPMDFISHSEPFKSVLFLIICSVTHRPAALLNSLLSYLALKFDILYQDASSFENKTYRRCSHLLI